MNKKNLKIYRTILICIDIVALFQLIIQIMFKELTYINHIMLIALNIILFTIKPKEESKK